MTNYCTNKFSFDDLCYMICNQNTDITDITLRNSWSKLQKLSKIVKCNLNRQCPHQFLKG